MKLSNRSYFGQIVKWNPEEENVGEEFEKGEKGVSDPVSQPLGVVILLFAFDRFYAVWTKGKQQCQREGQGLGEGEGADGENDRVDG